MKFSDMNKCESNPETNNFISNVTYVRNKINPTLKFGHQLNGSSSTTSISSTESIKGERKIKIVLPTKSRKSFAENCRERFAKLQTKKRINAQQTAKIQRIDRFNCIRNLSDNDDDHNDNNHNNDKDNYKDNHNEIKDNLDDDDDINDYLFSSPDEKNDHETFDGILLSNRISSIPYEPIPSAISRYSTYLSTSLSSNSLRSTKTFSSIVGLRKIPQIKKIETPNRQYSIQRKKMQLSDIIFSWNEVDSSVRVFTITFGFCFLFNLFAFLKNIF